MNRCPLLCIAISVLVLGSAGTTKDSPEITTSDSDEHTAAPVGHDCTSNVCSTSGQGCASCAVLAIHLPPNAWVTKTHCLTTANYPADYARHDLHETKCGEEISWSLFETPLVTASADEVLVRAVYHNRSSNRPRDAKIRVEWTSENREH